MFPIKKLKLLTQLDPVTSFGSSFQLLMILREKLCTSCGIPEITSDHSEQVLLTITLRFHPVRKFFIQFNSSPCKPKLFNLVNNLW